MPPKKKPKYILDMQKEIKLLTEKLNAQQRDQTSASGGLEGQGLVSESTPPGDLPGASAATFTTRAGRVTRSTVIGVKKPAKQAAATVSKAPTEVIDPPSDPEVLPDPQSGASGVDHVVPKTKAIEHEVATLDKATIADTIHQIVTGNEDQDDSGDNLDLYLPAGTTLDSKIKRRIISGEYVDLCTLQPKFDAPQPMFSSPFHFTAPPKPKQPANFIEWLRLFIVYASVYGTAHPDQAIPMMSYILRIHGLYARQPVSFAWRMYDEAFRKMRVHSPKLAWYHTHSTILAQVDEAINIQNWSNKGRSGGGNKVATGAKGAKHGCCYAFNDIAKICSRPKCNFLHRCQSCLGPHPAYQCKSPGTKPDNRARPAGGGPKSK